jgi:hypothetical protein
MVHFERLEDSPFPLDPALDTEIHVPLMSNAFLQWSNIHETVKEAMLGCFGKFRFPYLLYQGTRYITKKGSACSSSEINEDFPERHDLTFVFPVTSRALDNLRLQECLEKHSITPVKSNVKSNA